MTYSYTTTDTWSHTHARYVAGKVAADLKQLQQAYGLPSDHSISQYLEELTVLLADGYVREVTYGFRRNGIWVVALKYAADMYGNLNVDDRSGRIPRGANIDEAVFASFMDYSTTWDRLSDREKQSIRHQLPFTRSYGDEPLALSGAWNSDKSYAAAGCGLRRSTVGGEW